MKAPFRSIVPNRKNEPIVTYSRVMFPLLVETGREGERNWRRKNTGSGLVGRRAKNGRANKARFVERAGRSSSKLQRACAWSRDTDNVLRIDLIRVANQISRTGCTCHYLITVTIRGCIGSLMGSNTEIPIAIDRTVCAASYVCTLCVRVVDNLKVTRLTEEYWEDTL